MTDPYLHNREFFGTVSGNYRALAADTGLIALVPAIPAHTLFIQKLHIEVTTPTGAELWTFQDGAGIPIVPSVSAAAVSHFDFDFGPDGVPCTEATGFQLNVTGATGAIGWVTWEGFKKLTLGTAASAGGGAPAPSDVGTPPIIVSKPSLGITSTDGAVLANPTPASAAVPVQQSPRLRFRANVWNTALGTSQTDDFWIESKPVSGAVPAGQLTFGISLNGGPNSLVMTLGSAGDMTLAAGLNVANISVASQGSLQFGGYGYFSNGNDSTSGHFRLLNNAASGGVGFDVATDGTFKIRTRTHSADGQLSAASVRGNAVTFANLPAAPVEGMLAAVTDSTVNTWGTVIVGGGANHVLAYYNGTNWIVK